MVTTIAGTSSKRRSLRSPTTRCSCTHAVSLNRGDVDMLSGKSDRDLTGFVAGTDAAGEIVQVGKRVTRARKGDARHQHLLPQLDRRPRQRGNRGDRPRAIDRRRAR